MTSQKQVEEMAEERSGIKDIMKLSPKSKSKI